MTVRTPLPCARARRAPVVQAGSERRMRWEEGASARSVVVAQMLDGQRGEAVGLRGGYKGREGGKGGQRLLQQRADQNECRGEEQRGRGEGRRSAGEAERSVRRTGHQGSAAGKARIDRTYVAPERPEAERADTLGPAAEAPPAPPTAPVARTRASVVKSGQGCARGLRTRWDAPETVALPMAGVAAPPLTATVADVSPAPGEDAPDVALPPAAATYPPEASCGGKWRA